VRPPLKGKAAGPGDTSQYLKALLMKKELTMVERAKIMLLT